MRPERRSGPFLDDRNGVQVLLDDPTQPTNNCINVRSKADK